MTSLIRKHLPSQWQLYSVILHPKTCDSSPTRKSREAMVWRWAQKDVGVSQRLRIVYWFMLVCVCVCVCLVAFALMPPPIFRPHAAGWFAVAVLAPVSGRLGQNGSRAVICCCGVIGCCGIGSSYRVITLPHKKTITLSRKERIWANKNNREREREREREGERERERLEPSRSVTYQALFCPKRSICFVHEWMCFEHILNNQFCWHAAPFCFLFRGIYGLCPI